MNIKTQRLEITEFTLDMVEDVHLNSLDEDNRKFNPDEVFETMEDAQGQDLSLIRTERLERKNMSMRWKWSTRWRLNTRSK